MRKDNSSYHRGKAIIGGINYQKYNGTILNLTEISPNLPFTEYEFYEEYRDAYEKTELGWMKKILLLREMAKSFGLVGEIRRPSRGRCFYFS